MLQVNGRTAQGWFSPDGAQLETGRSVPVPRLEAPVSPAENLDLAIGSVYCLGAGLVEDVLPSSLAAGDIWRFRFNYRPQLSGRDHLSAQPLHLAPNAALA